MIQKANEIQNHPSKQTQNRPAVEQQEHALRQQQQAQNQQQKQQNQENVRLFIGPVLDTTTNSSIETFLQQKGLEVSIIDRQSRKKKKFVIVEVSEPGSKTPVSDLFNTYHFIEGLKMRIRKYRLPEPEEDGDPDLKIYVGNLPREVTKDEVEQFFGQYGAVSRVFIKKKSRKKDFAFGFVTFVNKEAAEKLRAIQNLEFKDKTLFIKNADLKYQHRIGAGSGPHSSQKQSSSSNEASSSRHLEAAKTAQALVEGNQTLPKPDQNLQRFASKRSTVLPAGMLSNNLEVYPEEQGSENTAKRLDPYSYIDFKYKAAPGNPLVRYPGARPTHPAGDAYGRFPSRAGRSDPHQAGLTPINKNNKKNNYESLNLQKDTKK